MLENWFQRHRDRRSLILHAVGIPLTVAAIPVLIAAIARPSAGLYALAAAMVGVGYALQFIGHALEGNDPGEMILIKKLFGRPYQAIADPSAKEQNDERTR